MKQFFAWAIVGKRGNIALFDARCPLYWRRGLAKAECDRRNIHVSSGSDYRVVRVTVLPVHKP